MVQVLDYRQELVSNVAKLTEGTDYDITAFKPRCAVIIGNSSDELADDTRRKSFELFRTNQSDVEIVTFDELFRKIEILANLFSLTRKKSDS